jgi:hypothetical protein
VWADCSTERRRGSRPSRTAPTASRRRAGRHLDLPVGSATAGIVARYDDLVASSSSPA